MVVRPWNRLVIAVAVLDVRRIDITRTWGVPRPIQRLRRVVLPAAPPVVAES